MPATKSKPALSVSEWLKERLEICERIAGTKTGADRAGWLEDAEYFRAAVNSHKSLVEALARSEQYIVWALITERKGGGHADTIATAERDLEMVRAALAAAGQS